MTIALLAGCASTAPEAPETATDWRTATGTPEVTAIKIGVEPGSLFLPAFAAQENGYFEEEGLTVEFQTIKGAPESLAAIAGKELAFAPLSYFFTFALDESRPVELDVVAGMDSLYGGGSFITLPNSGITKASELEGKTVAVPSINSACDLAGGSVLEEKYGVDVDKVNFVELGGPDIPAALERGTIDAACSNSTTVEKLKQGANAKVLATIQEGKTETMPILAWWGSREFTAANPNTTAAFARAIAKGNDWVNANEGEARALLERIAELPASIASSMKLPEFGDPDVAAVRLVAKLLKDAGVTETELDVEEITGLK